MPRVFISHSSRDRDVVERDIIAPLRISGIEIWYSRDTIQTADEWERKIKEGLRSCEWFIVALSSRSIASQWVKAEVHWALTNREGRVIPVLIEDCDPQDLDLRLPRIHHEDFSENLGKAQKKIITRLTGQIPTEPPLKKSRKSRRPLWIGSGLLAMLLIVIVGLKFIVSYVNKPPDHVNDDNSVIKPDNTPANDTPVVPSSPTDAQKLVNDIQVSKSAITSLNYFLSYAAAHKISHSLDEHLNTADPSSIEMKAEMFGFYAVISVTSYRQFGYIMFLDSRNNKLALEDDNFEFDIRNVQFINFGENSLPNAIVEVQYTTSHGTGTYCSSVKIYTLTGDQVRLSLDKPYFEYNTGWGAFAEEYVEFKSRNIYELNPKTSVCRIRTIGIAVVRPFDENDEHKASNKVNGGKIIAYRPLPREVYIWNPRSNQFEQKEGRIVAGQGYMTSIYADYATPTGDWFHKPESINKNKSLLDLLYDESQTGEIP